MDKRFDALQRTVTVLSSGGSIEVLGEHGSGKSTFLTRIIEHFRNQTWRVFVVRGNQAFRNAPLVCLALAGVKSASTGRISAIPEIVAELEERLAGDDALLVIDDADFIDEASWGALSALRNQLPIALIQSRLPGSHRHRPGAQLEGLTVPPGFGVQLGAVQFDDLSEIISQRLGNPVSPSAMSQVFASSGGNIGLSLAVATAAVHEGSLALEDGEWVTKGHLWSDSLIPHIDAILAQLNSAQWDGLEMLALLGVVDADTFVGLTDHDLLVQLEERALIELVPSGGRLLVSVKPPLLVDFFRHRPAAARRHRLSAMLEGRLREESGELVPFRLPSLATAPDAPYVRLVHEHLRTRLLLAQAEWSRSPSKATASNLIELSVWSGANPEELVDLFAESAGLPEDDEEAAVRWVLLRADFLLYFGGDYQEAKRLLLAEEPRFPRFGLILRARVFEIENAVTGSRSIDELPDPGEVAREPKVAAALHIAIGTGLLTNGHPEDAGQHLHAAETYTGPAESIGDVALHVLSDYFGEHPDRARSVAELGYDEAKVTFSNIEIRGYGYLVALMGLLDGRTRQVDQILRLAFSLGEPVRQPPFVHISFLVIGTVLAARRGDHAMAQLLRGRYEALGVPDSPVPGGARSWATAQLAASEGDPHAAAEIAEAGANELWDRGSKLSAAFGYIVALEFEATQERLDRLENRISSVSSPFIAESLDYVKAIISRSPEELREVAGVLEKRGRYGHALAALSLAADLAERSGDAAAAAARAKHDELSESLPEGEYQEVEVNTVVPQFTVREQQIAARAIAGRSNQQIADELVLSVRTVESHMHRIMKKAGVDRRTDLGRVGPLRSERSGAPGLPDQIS